MVADLELLDSYGRGWWVRTWNGQGCVGHGRFDRECPDCTFAEALGTADAGVIHENWNSDPYRLTGRPLDVVLDCGANIGSFALRALQEGAERVYCWEPEPDNLTVFYANCEEEMADGRIILDQRALWSATGETVHLVPMKGCSGVGDAGLPGAVAVETVSFPDVLSEFDSIDFLKMDLEGSEVETISACSREVIERVRFIAMEYHGIRPEWGWMVRLLSGTFDIEIVGQEDPAQWSGGMLFATNRGRR